jgi:SAM-dependent methyltransferase
MTMLACPRCHTLLEEADATTLHCQTDGLTFRQVDGIWRMLLPERESLYARFIREYEAVRRFEGRGSADAAYYRALPYHPSPDWKIRAKSFDAFLEVLKAFEKPSEPLHILDLGAGNGWLSNRLALREHEVIAVDLTVNEFDGLGCQRFYESEFVCAQAEFDYLPIPDGSMDMVLFNASLHYSVNYKTTLSESLRVLKHSGLLVILDSPVYRDPKSGEQMVREREAQFIKQFGFASNALPSENYLTYARLDNLARELGITWQLLTPFYGWRWMFRPLIAKWLRRREPAKFHVIVGAVNKQV